MAVIPDLSHHGVIQGYARRGRPGPGQSRTAAAGPPRPFDGVRFTTAVNSRAAPGVELTKIKNSAARL